MGYAEEWNRCQAADRNARRANFTGLVTKVSIIFSMNIQKEVTGRWLKLAK
jgi:hypothetical protein